MRAFKKHVMTPVAATTFAALDQAGATRTRPFASAVAAGIRVEATTRGLNDVIRRRPARPVNVHIGGQGPPVILLNGWSASGLVWPEHLVTRLERRFTVLRVDNRGTGWSRRCPRPYSIPDLADDVHAIADRYELHHPVIVGISMGGMIAQELAVRWPDLPGHLVLLATAPPSPEYTPPRPGATANLFVGATTVDLASRIRATWLPVAGAAFAASPPESFDAMVRAVVGRPTPYFAIADQARAVAAWHGAGRLKRITSPTTVVHGAADPLIPVRNGMRLSQLIPGARYIDLPRIGHLLPFEAPDLLADIIEHAEVRP